MNRNKTESIARWSGWLVLTLGLVVAGWLICTDQASSSSRNANQLQPTDYSKSLDSRDLIGNTSTRSIQDIHVGDRVVAHNPEVSNEERQAFEEPDWSSWLKISLEMPKQDGQTLHIETLRSEEWLLERGSFLIELDQSATDPAQSKSLLHEEVATDLSELNVLLSEMMTCNETSDTVPLAPIRPWVREFAKVADQVNQAGYSLSGLVVELDLAEMGAVGPAYVTHIESCPDVEMFSGNVVTSTFHHPPSTAVLDVTFEGEEQAIGVTDGHLFWSVDQQAFVLISEMETGDLVHSFQGDTKRITSKLPRPGPQTVYNLEVWGEHVYFVGELGVLVHNMCGTGTVNLDAGTARALVGEGSPVRHAIKSELGGRQIVITQTALNEFQDAVSRLAGPVEAARAQRLLNRVTVIADNPSARAMNLNLTRSVGESDKIIFGTGDQINATTFTSDAKFLRGASAQGVDFDAFVHDTFSFLGI